MVRALGAQARPAQGYAQRRRRLGLGKFAGYVRSARKIVRGEAAVRVGRRVRKFDREAIRLASVGRGRS